MISLVFLLKKKKKWTKSGTLPTINTNILNLTEQKQDQPTQFTTQMDCEFVESNRTHDRSLHVKAQDVQ